MKKYKQLSLFDEEDLEKKQKGNKIVFEMLEVVSTFTETDKDNIKEKLTELLKLYSSYDPNVECQEQLSSMGRVRLVGLKQVARELEQKSFMNRETYTRVLDIMDTGIKDITDFNLMVAFIVKYSESTILDGTYTAEKATVDLVQEYFCILSDLSVVLGV